jgi:peptide/nickel transport system permease protein
VLTAVTIGLIAPYLAPHRAFALQPDILKPPSANFPLGTDTLGRDILSYLIYGTRAALIFGLGVAGLSLVVGIVMGAVPGYFGGRIDDLVMRLTEVILMIPQLVLVIIVVALIGNDIIYTMIIVGLTYWPANAKIARSQVLALKHRDYVRAARASGAGHMRILFQHIIPNGLYPVIANSALQMGYAILLESSLSFLGLGDPNFPSWGQILFEANLRKWAWWMGLFPGIAILVTVLGFNLIGDGLNHALNPRLRTRSE